METVTRVKPEEQPSPGRGSSEDAATTDPVAGADVAHQPAREEEAGHPEQQSPNGTTASSSPFSSPLEESPDAAPAAVEIEQQQRAAAGRRSSPSTKNTAAAAVVGGVAGLVGPAAAMGPLAMAGGPVVGLGVAGVVAYGAAYRSEGDTFGELSRQLGDRGLEAAAQAKQLGKALHQRTSEVTVCVQERLATADQTHQISAKAQQAGRKALEDVQSLGSKSLGEVKGLWSALWGPVMTAPAEQRSTVPGAKTALTGGLDLDNDTGEVPARPPAAASAA